MEKFYFETIINNEVNDSRFENFCCDLFSQEYDALVMPTSKTYDLGRDGRQLDYKGTDRLFISSTLNKGIEEKTLTDINRLKETTPINTLIYCCSISLSEHAIDSIKEKINKHSPDIKHVEMLGSIQLASLAEKHIDVFNKYYSQDLKSVLSLSEQAESDEESIEQKGLRLALLSFACDDAESLRNNLSKQLTLELLQKSDALTPSQIAKSLSDSLHLARAINKTYVIRNLTNLSKNGFVEDSDGRWALTDKGRTEVKSVTPEAFDYLLQGRSILLNGIYELTGYQLGADPFSRVWNVFQDYIANIFYTNGLHTVQLINALLNNEAAPDDYSNYNEMIDELASKAVTGFSDNEMAESIKQAILDIFSERSGDAFQWLASICTVFVSLCSLGLEGSSASQVVASFKRTKLVIDTDILISLMCIKEPQHDEVEELINGWQKIGGEIYVHQSVLQEAAYHAWISEHDYNEVSRNFKDIITDREVEQYIQNAFVKTFKIISEKNYGYRAWNNYIAEFRGDSEYDYTKLLEICREDYGINILKNTDVDEYKDFIEEVKSFISDKRKSTHRGFHISRVEAIRIEDKSENDALLFSSILQFRNIERSKGSGNTMSLITSSSLFQLADSKFSDSLGTPEAVLTLSAVSYMFSLLPGVKYNIASLRKILFSFGRRIKLRPEERIALRILKSTSEFDIPFAKRATLRRNLRDEIRKQAINNDKKIEEVYDEFIKFPATKSKAENTAHMIVNAVEKIASFQTTSDKKLYDTIQEKEKYRKENEALREQIKKERRKRK